MNDCVDRIDAIQEIEIAKIRGDFQVSQSVSRGRSCQSNHQTSPIPVRNQTACTEPMPEHWNRMISSREQS